MKSTIYNILQRQSLRLSLCALAVSVCSVALAQDDLDEDSSLGFKAPKRAKVVDTNPTINVKGVVVDEATNKPVAGVRLQTLNDNRYAAMTNGEGQFTIKLPTFATALFVQAPQYLSQQVAIIAGDSTQQVVSSC